jgi:hypothetical protein
VADIYHSNGFTQIYLDGELQVNSTDLLPIAYNRNRFGVGGRTGGQTNEHRYRAFGMGKYSMGISTVIGSETGVITAVLGFNIRNDTDTANVNTCVLGVLSTAATSSCGYRLKITSNATGGYSVFSSTNGGLDNGSYIVNNASAGNGGSGGTQINNSTAGAEVYGVNITKGNSTGGTTALASGFNAGANNSVNFSHSANYLLLTSGGPNAPSATDTLNTVLVNHNINIGGSTPPGNYSQRITYQVTPNF